jgi:hypothetical protein
MPNIQGECLSVHAVTGEQKWKISDIYVVHFSDVYTQVQVLRSHNTTENCDLPRRVLSHFAVIVYASTCTQIIFERQKGSILYVYLVTFISR